MLKYLLLISLYTVTAMAGNLQNADFATSAQITGAGGTVAQLLNSSKMYNTVDSEIMNTSIARWNAKLSSPVVLTSQVSGILPLANGGTNAALTAANGAIPYSTASAFAFLAPGTSGQVLTSGGAGAPTWSNASTGTVTSVAETVPAFLSISGSPITTSGTLAIGFSGSALPIANGGTAGTTANGAFNNLSPMTTAGDITYENNTPVAARLAIGSTGNVLTVSGGLPVWAAPATSGTVTSVALTVPSILSISGSPITSSGTLAVTLANESANTVFAGPASGGAAAPTFRALNVADMTIATQAISASAIDWSTGNLFTKTLGANTTFTFSNQTSGQTIVVRLTNTASNYTVTWPTVKWAGGTAPVMTVGATSDVYTFVYDGSNTYGSVVQDMH